MATLLRDGDFEINGHYTGQGKGVYVSTVERGSVDTRHQDEDNPNGDSVMWGRDFYSPPTITLGFVAKHGHDTAAAAAAMGALEAAWRNARRAPGDEATLRYRLGGRTRLIYGRPREFAPNHEHAFYTGYQTALAQFKAGHVCSFGDELQSLRLSLVPPSSGG